MRQKILFSGVVVSTVILFISYFLLEKEIKEVEEKKVVAPQKTQVELVKKIVTPKVVKKVYVSKKKKRFFSLILKPVATVHKELYDKFLFVQKSLQNETNKKEIQRLKKVYRVKTDKELLYAIKPHPKSIVIAQAALESAWGTSRIFKEANNIFGMWSKNENEPRIPALVKRDDNRTIWLRKFDTLEQSIRSYYFLMATGTKFKKFRKIRYETQDITKILPALEQYAEIGKEYPKRLMNTIKHNNLTQYDKEQ